MNSMSWILHDLDLMKPCYRDTLITLSSKDDPFYASVSNGATSTTFYTFVMVQLLDLNPRPPTPKVEVLPTEL